MKPPRQITAGLLICSGGADIFSIRFPSVPPRNWVANLATCVDEEETKEKIARKRCLHRPVNRVHRLHTCDLITLLRNS